MATYSYDEAGRRIKKVLANGQVSYFFYSQAGQLMSEYNASTSQPTDYLYLNGKLIARYLAGQNPTYLLTDRLGTPVRETDPTGAVTQSFSYRPFGQLYSGPSQQQPGYTGHVFDPESSLSYMQARYQDGGLGQFLSVDPMAPTPGDVLSFSRYAYAGNNPVSNTDPDGKESACVTMRAGCGGSNPAAEAAAKSVLNVGLGILDGIANEFKNMFHSGTPEGDAIEPSDSSQAAGIAIGGGIAKLSEAVATDGESTSASELSMVKEEIYEFPDMKADGKPYVGQSGRLSARLATHQKNGRLSIGTEKVTSVAGGKDAREVAEHTRIQEITGGVPASQSDAVSNKVNPIGPARQHLLDKQQ